MRLLAQRRSRPFLGPVDRGQPERDRDGVLGGGGVSTPRVDEVRRIGIGRFGETAHPNANQTEPGGARFAGEELTARGEYFRGKLGRRCERAP